MLTFAGLTASLQYNKPFDRGNWASAFVWGRNHASSPGEIHNLNGYTAESRVNFLDKNYLYIRLELVDKDDLLRPADKALLGIAQDHPSFRIGAYHIPAACATSGIRTRSRSELEATLRSFQSQRCWKASTEVILWDGNFFCEFVPARWI